MEANFHPTQQDVKISPQSKPEATEQDLECQCQREERIAWKKREHCKIVLWIATLLLLLGALVVGVVIWLEESSD